MVIGWIVGMILSDIVQVRGKKKNNKKKYSHKTYILIYIYLFKFLFIDYKFEYHYKSPYIDKPRKRKVLVCGWLVGCIVWLVLSVY